MEGKIRRHALLALLAAVSAAGFLFAAHSAHAQDITTGLVGYWSFEDGTGSSVAADSKGSNHASLTNMNVNSAWVTGKSGGALEFDGTNDHLVIPGLLGNPANVTISAWVNLDSPDNNGADAISVGDNIGIRLDQDGRGVTVGSQKEGTPGFSKSFPPVPAATRQSA